MYLHLIGDTEDILLETLKKCILCTLSSQLSANMYFYFTTVSSVAIMLWCKLNDILCILSNTLVSTHLTTSAVIAVESLDRLANTMIEIGQDHLLDQICFESMTTLSVDCLSKGI